MKLKVALLLCISSISCSENLVPKVENGVAHSKKLVEKFNGVSTKHTAQVKVSGKTFTIFRPSNSREVFMTVVSYPNSSPEALEIFKMKADYIYNFKKTKPDLDTVEYFEDKTHSYIFTLYDMSRPEGWKGIEELTPGQFKLILYRMAEQRYIFFENFAANTGAFKDTELKNFEEKTVMFDIFENFNILVGKYLSVCKEITPEDKKAIENFLESINAYYNKISTTNGADGKWQDIIDIFYACPISFPPASQVETPSSPQIPPTLPPVTKNAPMPVTG